jgi:chromosomal replication initiation ATPase DnaA
MTNHSSVGSDPGTDLSGRHDEKEIPQLKRLKAKVTLETVVNCVCEEFGCDKEQIIAKGRKKNKARQAAIYLARDLSAMSGKNLGLYFGGLSGALITIMSNRTAQEAAQNRSFRKRLEKTKKRISHI